MNNSGGRNPNEKDSAFNTSLLREQERVRKEKENMKQQMLALKLAQQREEIQREQMKNQKNKTQEYPILDKRFQNTPPHTPQTHTPQIPQTPQNYRENFQSPQTPQTPQNSNSGPQFKRVQPPILNRTSVKTNIVDRNYPEREVSGLTGHRVELREEQDNSTNVRETNFNTNYAAFGEDDNLKGSRVKTMVVETFTSPGKVLKQEEELLTQNKFMNTLVLQNDTTSDMKKSFQRYYEEIERDEELKRQVAVAGNDALKSNPYKPASEILQDPFSKVDTTKDPYNAAFENTRYNKVQKTYVHIDSADRNEIMYPNSNDFRIFLPRIFRDVKQVSLISLEFPNTDQVVKGDSAEVLQSRNQRKQKCGELINTANNHLYWIDEEDADYNWNCLIYDAKITPGNYVVTQCQCNDKLMQTEIETKVAGVNVFEKPDPANPNQFIGGGPHQFIVTIDEQTNLVSIQSINSVTLDVNPISTQAGTNKVTISQTNHGFTEGESITILGATSVGGIPAANINGEHTIEIIDENTYQYTVPIISTFTQTGGGANVTAGNDRPIQLLFSNLDTIGHILGFPQEDSSDPLAQEIQFIDTSPIDLATMMPTLPGEVPAWIQSDGHDLIPGEDILIMDTDTIPNINGLQTVTRVIRYNDHDYFEIGSVVKVVNNQTITRSTVLGSVCLSLDEHATYVTNVTMSMDGYFETPFPHLIPPGSTIYMGNVINGILLGGNTINLFHTLVSANVTKYTVEKEILYEGDYSNAFVVQTSSTSLQPITGIIPKNNGVFSPPVVSDPCCAIQLSTLYTGTDVPIADNGFCVLFKDTETDPDINGVVSVDIDNVTGNCNAMLVKSTPFIQSFIPKTTGKLVGIYVRVGNGVSESLAKMSVYEGVDGSLSGTLLGSSPLVSVTNTVTTGTYFCLPDIVVETGNVYSWEISFFGTTSVLTCGNTGDLYPDGVGADNISGVYSPIAGGFDYEFRTYMSPGLFEIDYYSQTTGKFDLKLTSIFNGICDVFAQNPNQSFIRSIGCQLYCIDNATVETHGSYIFDVTTGMEEGDNIYIRRIGDPNTTTEPFIKPDITGITSVDIVESDYKFDTTTLITYSAYKTSELFQHIELIKTNDSTTTPIQNIFPKSTGYLCKNTPVCDPSRPQCVLCPGDKIVVRNSELINCNIAPLPSPYPEDVKSNLFGCFEIAQVYTNVSDICTDIFSIVLNNESEGKNKIQPPVDPQFWPTSTTPPFELGECARLYTEGGQPGVNGIFNVATVNFTSEVFTTPATSPQLKIGPIWPRDRRPPFNGSTLRGNAEVNCEFTTVTSPVGIRRNIFTFSTGTTYEACAPGTGIPALNGCPSFGAPVLQYCFGCNGSFPHSFLPGIHELHDTYFYLSTTTTTYRFVFWDFNFMPLAFAPSVGLGSTPATVDIPVPVFVPIRYLVASPYTIYLGINDKIRKATTMPTIFRDIEQNAFNQVFPPKQFPANLPPFGSNTVNLQHVSYIYYDNSTVSGANYRITPGFGIPGVFPVNSIIALSGFQSPFDSLNTLFRVVDNTTGGGFVWAFALVNVFINTGPPFNTVRMVSAGGVPNTYPYFGYPPSVDSTSNAAYGGFGPTYIGDPAPARSADFASTPGQVASRIIWAMRNDPQLTGTEFVFTSWVPTTDNNTSNIPGDNGSCEAILLLTTTAPGTVLNTPQAVPASTRAAPVVGTPQWPYPNAYGVPAYPVPGGGACIRLGGDLTTWCLPAFIGDESAWTFQCLNSPCGSLGVTAFTTSSDALCLKTSTPHSLQDGDSIYILIPSESQGNVLPYLWGCSYTAPLELPYREDAQTPSPPPPDRDEINEKVFSVITTSNPLIFKIYGLSVVSSVLFSGYQFYYHKICGNKFTPITKFFPLSYCGMIESFNHQVTPDDNLYFGKVNIPLDAQAFNGLVMDNEIAIIDTNFLGFTSNSSALSISTATGELTNQIGTSTPEIYAPTNEWSSVVFGNFTAFNHEGVAVAVSSDGTGNYSVSYDGGKTWILYTSFSFNGSINVVGTPLTIPLGLTPEQSADILNREIFWTTVVDGLFYTTVSELLAVGPPPMYTLDPPVPGGFVGVITVGMTPEVYKSVAWIKDIGSFDKGVFVAVSETVFSYSVDAVTWFPFVTSLSIPTTLPPILEWQSICSGYYLDPLSLKQFSGTIDNTTLTITSGTPPNVNDVIYSKYVAEGTKVLGVVTLGSTYTVSVSQKSPVNITMSSAQFNVPVFVAVASSALLSINRIVTSIDGINWPSTPINLNNYTSVCFGKYANDGSGLFVAVASNVSGLPNQRVIISSNPTGLWLVPALTPENNWSSVCYSEFLELFVAVANDSTSTQAAMTSSDGVNWTLQNTPRGNWTSVVWSEKCTQFNEYGDGMFVAVADKSALPGVIMTSRNGINWNILSVSSSDLDRNWNAVTWVPLYNRFLAVGDKIVANALVVLSNSNAMILDESDIKCNREVLNANVGASFAGEFVFPTSSATPLIPTDISTTSDGVIYSYNHGFGGGECLYFLNDTNINQNVSNPLAEHFFTVSPTNLTLDSFQINVPITNVGPIMGNAITTSTTVAFFTPGAHTFLVPPGTYKYRVIASGAGGGSSENGPPNGALGGKGGLVTAEIDVTPNTFLQINIGGPGKISLGLTAGTGGVNGGGYGQAINSVDYFGSGAGGGGATDIRTGGFSLSERIVVAGGGGGAAYNLRNAGGVIALQGGDGGGLSGNNGTGAATSNFKGTGGSGGTQVAPAPEIEPGLAGSLGQGGTGAIGVFIFTGLLFGVNQAFVGSNTFNVPAGFAAVTSASLNAQINATPTLSSTVFLEAGTYFVTVWSTITTDTLSTFPSSIVGLAYQNGFAIGGGGGGFYGGGSGTSVPGNVYIGGSPPTTDSIVASGGGGSSFGPIGSTFVVGGGSLSDSPGYVILQRIDTLIYTTPTIDEQIVIPVGTTEVTIMLNGAGGGNNARLAPFAKKGGQGGNVVATLSVQSGDLLELTIGSRGLNGSSTVGFPGGGKADGGTLASQLGGSGGGYSEVKLNGTIVLVAAGGGGAGFTYKGGDGGGFFGADGSEGVSTVTTGGTQTLGGSGLISGTFHQGGNVQGGNIFYGRGGGGGGYYGGGAGGTTGSGSGTRFLGGGGGSSFVINDPLVLSGISITGGGATAESNGSATIIFNTNKVGSIPMGHFIQIPCDDTFNKISTIDKKTNGIFISQNDTTFATGPLPQGPCGPIVANTCIMLTDGNYTEGDEDYPFFQDVIANAMPFATPSPNFSTTYFDTEIMFTVEDIIPGNVSQNKVDIISTSDIRYPRLNGLSYIILEKCQKIPISYIKRDSHGSFSPVLLDMFGQSLLNIGTTIYMVSIHPTIPDLNGTHVVRYVDLGNATPQFFELEDVIVTDPGPQPVPTGNILYFRTPALTGNSTSCATINKIEENTCPTTITATSHGFPLGSANVVILDTITEPPISVGNIGIIYGATVIDGSRIVLPPSIIVDTGNGNVVADLCNINVVNNETLLVTQRGTWSKERISSNCGVPIFTPDAANVRTIVTTSSRVNVENRIMFSIINSVPSVAGTSIINVMLNDEWDALPFYNGQEVVISGHIGGDPHLDGTYKIFNVTPTSFKIPANTTPLSTGGTGGFVSADAPSTVSGHGLLTGDQVIFMKVMSDPDINFVIDTGEHATPAAPGQTFEITKINDNQFSIPVLLKSVNNKCPGKWCTNVLTLDLPHHGMANGDIFFLYGSESVGGLSPANVNTTHGAKIQNVVTQEEKLSRKVARVIDGNIVQFNSNFFGPCGMATFPIERVLSGGFNICISSKNHTTEEIATGNLKNYGFNAIQTNLNCNGTLTQFLNLEQEPYIFLVSDVLDNFLTTGPVDQVFAKIQKTSPPGTVLYNTYVASPKEFPDPIAKLDEIDFQLLYRDGKPFDLRSKNYSMTLEILEYQDRHIQSGIASRRGIPDRGAVSQQGFVESTISSQNPSQNIVNPQSYQQQTNLTQRINN